MPASQLGRPDVCATLDQAPINTNTRYSSSRNDMVQMPRAVFFASATATTVRGYRTSNGASHETAGALRRGPVYAAALSQLETLVFVGAPAQTHPQSARAFARATTF